ncbi:MAG: PAS domain S-box protein [Leptospirales bacterium]
MPDKLQKSQKTILDRYLWNPLELLVYNSISPKKNRTVGLIFFQLLIFSVVPYFAIFYFGLSSYVIVNILYWQAVTFFLVNLFLPIYASFTLIILHEAFILALPVVTNRVEFAAIIPVILMLNAVFFLTYSFTKLKRMDLDKMHAQLQILRNKQSKIENLFDNEFYAIIMHDSGRVIDVNDTFITLFGYDRSEIINLDLAYIITTSNKNRFLKKLFLYEEFSLEAKGEKKNGSTIPIEVIGKTYYEGDQLLQYCFIRDITHLVEINLELENQKNYLQTILDAYPHALFVVDADGFTIRHTNKIAGSHRQKVYFKNLFESDIDNLTFKEYIRVVELVKKTKSSNIFEQEYIDENGEQNFMETHLHPFINDNGDVNQIVITAIDITWRKKAEQKLRKAIKNLEVMQDAVDEHAIVAVTDLEGHITYVNDKFLEVSGYERKDLLGKNHKVIRSGFHSREFFKHLWSTISSGQIWQGEIKNRTKNGEAYWVFSTIVPFIDETGKPYEYISIRTDITEQKKTVEELKNAKEEAEKANKAKSTFLANMSHEIRTPLNAVLGLADLTLDTELNLKQREYLNIIKSSGESLLSLINEVLDFSKIEAGKLQLNPYNFQLRRIIRSTLHLFFYEAKENDLKMGLDIDSNVPDNITCDAQRIKQILVNLLGNAMKFTESGHIVLRICATNRYSHANEIELKFSVIDTGIGISDDKKDLIFESFTQEDSSTTRKFGGTGLGTTISKQLSRQMGGDIGVECPPTEYLGKTGGKGSLFWFTVRAKVNVERTAMLEQSLKELKVNAIIFDFNNNLADWVEEYFKASNISYDIITSLKKGPTALTQKKYDFCLLVSSNLSDVKGVLDILLTYEGLINRIKIACIIPPEFKEEFILGYSKEIDEYISKKIKYETFLNIMGGMFTQGKEAELIVGGKDKLLKEKALLQKQSDKVNILVAEDNEVNQLLVKTALENKGYPITIAENGEEAVEMLKKKAFDIVFMDLQMPRMNGFEASEVIRKEISKTIPIIAVTANAFKEDKERSFASGMNAFITKPYKINDLIAAIHEWVYKKD